MYRQIRPIQQQYPPTNFPPTDFLAGAIRLLPKAGPDCSLQVVEIDAGQRGGRYSVTFVPRQTQGDRARRAWFWGIESGEQIPAADA
jgi:hypothetical protein